MPAHLHSFELHYPASRFIYIEPTTSLSTAKSVSSFPACHHFLCFSHHSCLLWRAPHLDLPPSCLSSSPSLLAKPHPVWHFVLSLSFLPLTVVFLVSFFSLNCFSHPTQTFRPVSPYLLLSSTFSLLSSLFLKSPSSLCLFFDSAATPLCRCLIPSMHCIPVAYPPFLHPLSGCCPPCHRHGQSACLAVPTGLTPATLKTLWGITVTTCVSVGLCLCVPVSICERQ